jgi:hypothetical protein
MSADFDGRKFVPKKDHQVFASREGRLVLLEYIEQQPMLLNNIGMASQLMSFYRKLSDSEQVRNQIVVFLVPPFSYSCRGMMEDFEL